MPLVKRYRPGAFPQFTEADENLRGYLRDEFDKISRLLGDMGDAIDSQRNVLGANISYFVRTDGNDANDGLSNTPTGAFKTIQKAVDVAAALDMSIFSATINVAAGAYDEMVTLKSYVGAGPINIIGDNVTPANVHISMSGSGDAIRAGGVIGRYALQGLKLSALTPGFNCIRASDSPTTIQLANIEFGVAAIHASAQFGATIRNGGPTRIVSGANLHYYADTGATIVDAGTTTTLVGAIAFGGYCRIIQQARFIANPAVGVTSFVGTATGQKFSVDTGGMIFTANSGDNFLPGSTPGVATPPGFYS